MNTAGTGTRPRYGVLDVVALLLREWMVMGAVFLAICAIGLGATFLLKKTYTAAASLFVGVGQEYVYQARVGTSQPSIPPSAAEVAQSEAAILNSLEVKQRVVRAMGIESFQDKPVTNPTAEDEAKAVKAMTSALSVDITPLSPVIALSYKSDDPRRSAQVLNTVIDQYLTYRREVFQDRATPAIRSRREAFEDELETADRAYEEFLRSHQIGDFATARATLAASYQTIFTERLSVQAQLNQTAQRLTTLSNQLSNMDREIPLQQDLNVSAQDQILQLRTQREQLLSRYQADAAPVQEIEAQIRRLQTYVDTGTAVGAKEVRVGPNPVWVQLEAQRATTAAERDSLGARLAVLDRQLAEINQRQARLNDLESRNATLSGNREVLSQSVREFQLREAQSRADNELVTAGADNVTVIERAQPPAEGKSLKLPLLALVILFAGFTALSVGLLRVFLRRGVWTPSSAERTFGVPVLAVAPAK
ncbi:MULTISPECIES: GumC family protein [unclassified Brevundimonas]|uniref:GumC family protein n=1 Tax=unclassified Brevundimonas TaxID=2622653 RepID=UPI0025C64C64|nr:MULTISPECIES: chain-length determining protein [unclassified Brevundimonas]